MARSRKEKNQKIYDDLEVELKNNKENNYEKKLKNIDPTLDASGENVIKENDSNIVKKNEQKNNSPLTVIAKKVNGEKVDKKNDVVVVNKEDKKVKKIEEAEIIEEEFDEPVSYTDKLSIEAILRAKLEQQQRLKEDKKNLKKSPTDNKYTPEMMQERIKQHEGVDVRKAVKLKARNYKWTALMVLVISLLAVIVMGIMLLFKII